MDDDILSLKKQLQEKDAEIAALKKKLEQTEKVCTRIHVPYSIQHLTPVCQAFLLNYCHVEASVLCVILPG